jgi:hypothetical protein
MAGRRVTYLPARSAVRDTKTELVECICGDNLTGLAVVCDGFSQVHVVVIPDKASYREESICGWRTVLTALEKDSAPVSCYQLLLLPSEV